MIIKIRKIGKIFEITRIFQESIVRRYAKLNNIEERVNVLCQGVFYV